MRITIAGYGVVGRYLEAVFASAHNVVLYDPPQGLGSDDDLTDCDFVIVAVPTPEGPDGAADISIVEDVVAKSSPRHAIVCESTVPVGTTQRLLDATRKPIVFVPEYAGETEGHPYREMASRTFFVYGGHEPSVSSVRDLYAGLFPQAKHFIVPPSTAEMVKYMENAFLATKVAFCNEFFDLCAATGVDYEEARALWVEDWRIGTSHTFVTPERGYDGKCLPKDVAAVIATGRHLGVPMEILETIQRANTRHRANRKM
jgi:UDPglucose 6-dehydrogenase